VGIGRVGSGVPAQDCPDGIGAVRSAQGSALSYAGRDQGDDGAGCTGAAGMRAVGSLVVSPPEVGVGSSVAML